MDLVLFTETFEIVLLKSRMSFDLVHGRNDSSLVDKKFKEFDWEIRNLCPSPYHIAGMISSCSRS